MFAPMVSLLLDAFLLGFTDFGWHLLPFFVLLLPFAILLTLFVFRLLLFLLLVFSIGSG